MQTEQPTSFALKKAYIASQEKIKEQQNIAHQQRIKQNTEQAKLKVQKHINAYEQQKSDLKTKREMAAKQGQIYVPAEPHFFLVLRIRGMNRVPPKERKTLDLLRLTKPNTAVLLVNNESTKRMLFLVRNYVAYGHIGINTLRHLVYKRGLCKKDNETHYLTNEVIEDTFNGKFTCVEDLISALWFNNDFRDVNRFILPYRLNCPKGGFRGKKACQFVMGGECGFQGNMIEDLIMRMVD